ncbi:hypothetical protein C0Q70_21453 [Pomacea canaliculata]|uniref:Uncharacterized protein n=1 Tax=Pomacea canaliculata TaxID=400727 RepID=A0A2T7NCL4_POMCA|nr:hypothetical protein C0Q70_21453 [Pomacea canaliculata]
MMQKFLREALVICGAAVGSTTCPVSVEGPYMEPKVHKVLVRITQDSEDANSYLAHTNGARTILAHPWACYPEWSGGKDVKTERRQPRLSEYPDIRVAGRAEERIRVT